MQKLVDLKAMAYRFLVVPVAGVLGWEAMGRRGKERGGGEELVMVLTHCREVSWWPDFVRDGEDGALRHGELLEPVLLGITGMCAGEKVILGIPKQRASLWVVYIFVWSCHERLV